jgi:hypothetical protein
MSKEFEEEFFLRRGEFHFARERSLIRMRPQDAERHPPDNGEILRRVVLARSGVVLVEDHVERPMEVVFDAQCSRRIAINLRGVKRLDTAA